jgi:hypothetical protein
LITVSPSQATIVRTASTSRVNNKNSFLSDISPS